MVYEWAFSTSRTDNMDPNHVGSELERLRKRAPNGVIEARDVVSAARNPNSPLHQWFTWKDSDAAVIQREYEARRLLRSVVVIRSEAEGNGPPVRAFVSLHKGKRDPGYSPTVQVLSRPDERERLIERFFGEVESLVRRYDFLEELQPTITEILEIVEEDKEARLEM